MKPLSLTKYGMTTADYMALFEKQKGLCAICQKPETAKRRKWLSVDHNHLTGKIRGLLCDRCNIGLGHFENNGILEAAIRYVMETADA